jgi:hypothetical protein
VSNGDLGDRRDRRFTRPVALPLAHDRNPSYRYSSGLHHPENRYVMRFPRYAAGCIGDEKDVVTVG